MQEPTSTEQELRARIEKLEERIRLLTGDPAAHQRLRPHGFNPRQARLLLILSQAAPATVSMAALTKDDESPSGIKVLVCKTRKVMKAKAVPGRIETLHSSGYRADPDLAAWVLDRTKEPEQPQPEEQEQVDVAAPEV